MQNFFSSLLNHSTKLSSVALEQDIAALHKAFWQTLICSPDIRNMGQYAHLNALLTTFDSAQADELQKLCLRHLCYLYPRISHHDLQHIDHTRKYCSTSSFHFKTNSALLSLIKQAVAKVNDERVYIQPRNQFKCIFPAIDYDFAEAIAALSHSDIIDLSSSMPLFVNTTLNSATFEFLLDENPAKIKCFFLALLRENSYGIDFSASPAMASA